jgi:MYXO-CTERM domain-containing protein
VQFKHPARLALAAAALLTVSPALAQYETNNTTTTTVEREEDNDFPWGLLGLLGLAGLLGGRKKERDIHVDARHNNKGTGH